MRSLAAAVLFAGCGRVAFDRQGTPGDATVSDLAQIDAAPGVVWPINGHSYIVVTQATFLSWDEANVAASMMGGHLATITSTAENDFVYALFGSNDAAWGNKGSGDNGPWLGGIQPDGSVEPDGNWTWVTGETWSYSAWSNCADFSCQMPDNTGPGAVPQKFLLYYAPWPTNGSPGAPGENRGSVWDDADPGSHAARAFIVEFE